MSEYLNETKDLIGRITNEVRKNDVLVKDLILKLAKHIEKGLKERRPEALNQAEIYVKTGRGYSKVSEDKTNPKNISKIIRGMKDKYFSNLSDSYISECLPEEYKETKAKNEKEFDIDIISDRDLIQKGAELTRRYKKLLDHGPAQDIKIKKSVEGIKNHQFKCDLTSIIVDIALNIEKDYVKGKLTDETVKELVRRFKTISDKRFAVDECKYEAILLACSTVDSLNNSTKYETEILDRWDMFDRETKCRKCNGDLDQCRADKCSCACHESVKRLTTKGLKWAKEHNPHLKKLDESIQQLSEWEDNICSIGKVILRNPHTKDFMKKADREKILYDHIEKKKCEQCEFFLEDHPNFFDE